MSFSLPEKARQDSGRDEDYSVKSYEYFAITINDDRLSLLRSVATGDRTAGTVAG